MKLSTHLFSLLFLLITSSSFAAPLHKVDFSADELQQFSGHYSSVFGYIHVQANGNKLTTFADGKRIYLVKKSDGKIYPVYKLLEIFPLKLGDISLSIKAVEGKQRVVLYEKGESHLIAEKFNNRPIPNSWKPLLGQYQAEVVKGKSTIKTVHLKQINGVLLASINHGTTHYPLISLSPTHVSLPDTGNKKSLTIQIEIKNKDLYLKYKDNEIILRKPSSSATS